MSFLKSKLNLLHVAVVATSLSFLPALASASPQAEDEIEEAPAAKMVSGGFQGSDLDADGVLDISEFTLYAGDQAVSGDADYTAIVSSGDYETAFKLLDADGSGSLSEDEVTGGDHGGDHPSDESFDEYSSSEDDAESESDY